MHKVDKILKNTEDPRTYKMVKKRKDLDCSYCKPHRNENASRKPTYGSQKPRYKNVDRTTIRKKDGL